MPKKILILPNFLPLRGNCSPALTATAKHLDKYTLTPEICTIDLKAGTNIFSIVPLRPRLMNFCESLVNMFQSSPSSRKFENFGGIRLKQKTQSDFVFIGNLKME